MSIKQQSTGKYLVRASLVINGKQRFRRVTSVQTKGEARLIENRLKLELSELKKNSEATVNWQTAVDQFINNLQLNRAVSTLYSAKTALEAHCSCWNELPITEIDESVIRHQIESKLLSQTTATKANLAKYIRGVFRVAVEKGQTRSNPANLVSYKKEKMSKLQAMSRDDVLTLLRWTSKMNHPWYPIFRVVYELGLRSGEALALTWGQVNFETKTVRIDRAWCSKRKTVGSTKTHEGRTIVLNDGLVAFLKELKLATPMSENVLPQISDWRQGRAARSLNSVQRDLGIQKTNFHSLRASFITHLLLAGIPITKVQNMVGHRDLKTTERYVRLTASDLKGATDPIGFDLELLDLCFQ